MQLFNYSDFTLLYYPNIAICTVNIPLTLTEIAISLVQKNLHMNFRILLFIICVLYLLQTAQSFSLLVFGTNSWSPIWILRDSMFQWSNSAWLLLAVERLYATWFSHRYSETKIVWAFRGFMLLFAAANAVANYLWVQLSPLDEFDFRALLYFYSRSSYFVLTAICSLILLFVIRKNKILYLARHENAFTIATRFQVSLNIRETRFIFPVLLLHTLYELVFCCMYSYKLYVEEIKVVVYSIVADFFRLVMAVAMIISSDIVKRTICQQRTNAAEVPNRTTDNETYFKQLKALWQ